MIICLLSITNDSNYFITLMFKQVPVIWCIKSFCRFMHTLTNADLLPYLVMEPRLVTIPNSNCFVFKMRGPFVQTLCIEKE